MIGKISVLLFIVLILTAPFCSVALADPAPYEFTLDPPACYVSTKLIFNFPTAANVTGGQDVSTVSQSATGYSYEGTPTTFTFIAKEVDIYTFTLIIHYDNVTPANETRAVIVSFWSGTLAPGGYTITTSQQDFVIHVRLSLTQQPTIPSAADIAQEEFHLVEERFVDMFNQLTVQNQQVADLNTKTTILSLVIMVFASVAVLFALVAYRERRRGSQS